MKLCESLVKAMNEGLMPKFKTKVQELLPKIPAKASGQQIAAMLKNNGVTDDEIRWTKLDRVLKQDKVTKQEIADHLEQHGVPFEPVSGGRRYKDYAIYGGQKYGEKLFTYKDKEARTDLEWDELPEPEFSGIEKQWNGYRPGADRSGRFNPPEKPIAQVFLELQETTGHEDPYFLMMSARVREEDTGWSWKTIYKNKIDSDADLPVMLETAQKVCEMELSSNFNAGYQSNHWGDVNNPVFHVRHQEFTDADGKSLWLIEEIQSDWHQQGRKRGYSQGQKFQILYDNNPLPTDLDSGNEFSSKEEAEAYVKSSIPERMRDKITYRPYQGNGVPDGPMKKSWEEMGFKWALHQAIEAGADRLGWVTGDIAAARFDLSLKIGAVMYNEKHGELRAYDVDGGGVSFERSGVKPDDLSDYIGKELAERLMAAQPGEDGKRRLSGLDMKIGGEGMKAAYDQRIVSIAKKIAKQTGAMIGKVGLQGASEDDTSDEKMQFVTDRKRSELAMYLTDGISDWNPYEPNHGDESYKAKREAKWNSDAEDWKECFYKAGKILTDPDINTPDALRSVANLIKDAGDIEDEWGDDPGTRDVMYEINRILDWDSHPSDLVDDLRAYGSWLETQGQKKDQIQVWYLDLNQKTRELAENGLRLTFESTKPDKWWLIKENKKAPQKPWWIV